MIFIKKLLQADDREVSRTEKTLALTLSNMVNILLSLLLSMAAARVLSKTEIAVNSQTFLAYNTFAPFLTLGITSGIYYYLAKNEYRKRAAVNECVVLTLSTSLLYGLFILLGGNVVFARMFKNSNISQTLYYLIPYALLITPTSVLNYVFVYENRMRFNAVFSTFRTLVTLSVVLVAMLWFRTGTAMVISQVVISCIFAVITLYLAYSILPKDNTRIAWKNMRALLSFSLPLGIAAVAGTISHDFDKWIVSAMLTPEVYAVYIQGARELPLISTITGAVSTVLAVDLTKAVKRGDYEVAVGLFRKVAEKTSLILMPIMVFCLASAKPLITFLYTDSYLSAVPIFCIYLLYMPIRVAYYGPFLMALGKSKFSMWQTIIWLLVNVALSVLFIYLFRAAEGAAIATVLSAYGIVVPLNLFVISQGTGIKWTRIFPFRGVLKRVIYSLPGGVIAFVLGAFVPTDIPALIVLVVQFSVFCFITAPLFIWKFQINWRLLFLKALTKFKQFFKWQ